MNQQASHPLLRLAYKMEGLIDIVGRSCSWLALVIVLLVATNVIFRYVASIGSVWSQELEWHLLAALILFGMSYALLRGEHIRVDVFYAHYSPHMRRAIDCLSALLTISVALIFVWLSLNYVEQSFVIDETSPDPGGIPHRWILKSFITIGFLLLVLQSTAELIKAIILPLKK
jgi:TRAP-type mannitol/chloroaromatic compound transport system permease small subunit